jgi:hypothetical protein
LKFEWYNRIYKHLSATRKRKPRKKNNAMLGANKIQVTYLGTVNVSRLFHIIDLLPEFGIAVLPLFEVGAVQEIRLLTQPVWKPRASFRHQVYFESSFLEDVEWVKGFANEEACLMAFTVERSRGRGASNDCTTGKRHFSSLFLIWKRKWIVEER